MYDIVKHWITLTFFYKCKYALFKTFVYHLVLDCYVVCNIVGANDLVTR